MSIKLHAIPSEAVAAAEAEILGGIARNFTSEEIARLAIAAAINAWTGMVTVEGPWCDKIVMLYNYRERPNA